MNDSAKDSEKPNTPEDHSLSQAANHPVLANAANTGDQTLDRVRDILFGQYVTSQSEKLDTLQRTLFDQLNQHISSVNDRLSALEESMDNDRVSAQQSDAQIREQLKTSITKANDDLVRSQEMVQSQLTELEKALSHRSVNKKTMAKVLNEIVRDLENGAS